MQPPTQPIPPQRKRFIDYLRTREFWSIFILTLVGGLVLVLLMLFAIMPIFTRHGSVVAVPEVTQKRIELAEDLLRQQDLTYTVIDSQFVADAPPKTVLTQDPPKGTAVKPGRTIYLTLSRATAPETKLPELIEVNLGQAQYMLENWGLRVGSISYVGGDAPDLVMQAKLRGRNLKPGDVVRMGSKIDLVVSRVGGMTVALPNLEGLSAGEATAILNDLRLRANLTYGGASPKYKTKGTVYKQAPTYEADAEVNQGSTIELYITGPRPAAAEGPAKNN